MANQCLGPRFPEVYLSTPDCGAVLKVSVDHQVFGYRVDILIIGASDCQPKLSERPTTVFAFCDSTGD
jgi:hypothetical protein